MVPRSCDMEVIEMNTEYIAPRMKQLKGLIQEMKAEMYWLDVQLIVGHRIDSAGRNIIGLRFLGDTGWSVNKRRYKEYLAGLISLEHECWLLSRMEV